MSEPHNNDDLFFDTFGYWIIFIININYILSIIFFPFRQARQVLEQSPCHLKTNILYYGSLYYVQVPK